MVELTRIYTKGGDRGKTSLSTGTRVAKYDLRVDAYGTVDEANAVLGLVRLHLDAVPDLDKIMARVQNDMFDLGADLATPLDAELSYEPLRVTEGQVDKLERDIDLYNDRLEPPEVLYPTRRQRGSDTVSFGPYGGPPGGTPDGRIG